MFDKKRIEKVITENYATKNLSYIAELLNKEGLTTKFNKSWIGPAVSNYARKVYKLDAKGLKNRDYYTNSNPDYIKPKSQEPILSQEVKTEVKETSLTVQQRLDLIDSSIFESQGKFFTDSLAIAKIFDKEHKHVLEAINNLDCSIKFKSVEFSADCFFDNRNRQQPKFNLTKKGFSFVVMGFTGEKASQFKEAYINRFEELEEQVRQPKQELITDPLTIMSMSIEALKKTNEKVNKLESELAEVKTNITIEIKQANKELEAKVDTIYNHSQKEIRLAQNRLKQTTMDLNVEETPLSYYEKTKIIVLDYTVAEGLKKEDSGINYGKLYGAMERVYQVPFRQNLADLNQQRPQNKQISTIRYFKDCGLEKELFEMACRLFSPAH